MNPYQYSPIYLLVGYKGIDETEFENRIKKVYFHTLPYADLRYFEMLYKEDNALHTIFRNYIKHFEIDIKKLDYSNYYKEIQRLFYSISESVGSERPIHLEYPENSLHPELQSKIAYLLVDVFEAFNLPIVVKTYSEVLIRTFQLLICKKRLHSSEVCLFQNKGNPYNRYNRINFSEIGMLNSNISLAEVCDNLSIDLYKERNNYKNNDTNTKEASVL